MSPYGRTHNIFGAQITTVELIFFFFLSPRMQRPEADLL